MPDALDLFLVEDDDNFAFVVRTCLQRAGHRVTLCRTAADALIVLGSRAFDLVLVDYGLDLDPEMSGLDLLRAIQREGFNTPVLMFTGKGNEEIAISALHAGA